MVDYWPRVVGVVSGAYLKIQDTNCFMCYIVQILHLIMELVHKLTKIPRFSEVGGIQCVGQLCSSSKSTSSKQ